MWRDLATILVSWGPLGILILAILDSVGLPVIGGVDVLLVTISAEEPNLAYLAAICAVAGSLAGSLVLFGLARKGGELLLAKHISSRQGARLHAWFERYGLITVFVPALSPIPLPMKIPVVCAGALEVSWFHFVFVVLTARLLRYFALAYLGRNFGESSAHFLVAHWVAITMIAVCLAVAAILFLRILDRRRALAGKPAVTGG